ncbi:MAG: hypothetical protein ACF8R9_14890 [Phycisphaerales bacterium JB054]
MARRNESVAHDESNQLCLLYRGGLADEATLLLDEYAASLEGWRGAFQLLGEVHFHSFPELRRFRGSRLIQIQVVAEEPGSWKTVVVFTLGAAAGGIIGNRADAALMWAFPKLVEWFGEAISVFVRSKLESTDVVALADVLREVLAARGYNLEEEKQIDRDQLRLADEDGPLDGDVDDHSSAVRPVQLLVERLDSCLKHATAPLDRSCTALSITNPNGSSVVEIGQIEREVIAAPLTLEISRKDWVQAHIRFERINRKTGRALIRFEDQQDGEGSHYSKIIDPAVKNPGNRYTEAFNRDEAIEVWVRQCAPEPGRLNLQWEIASVDPCDLPLFRSARAGDAGENR